VAALVAPLAHAATACAARAERALGLVVEGSCEVPVGALARVVDATLELEAFVGMPDGSRIIREKSSGPCAQAEAIGQALGEKLLAGGGREILRQLAQVRA
jgi:hydroxymethylbilane synthase